MLNAQYDHLDKVEVTGVVAVKEVLPDDTHGYQHQKFLVELSNGSTVMVANDLTYGTRAPVEPGERITIHGEYIWNPHGGVIHWTHRADSGSRHEGGWIEVAGKRYE